MDIIADCCFSALLTRVSRGFLLSLGVFDAALDEFSHYVDFLLLDYNWVRLLLCHRASLFGHVVHACAEKLTSFDRAEPQELCLLVCCIWRWSFWIWYYFLLCVWNVYLSNFMHKNETADLFEVQLQLFEIMHDIIHLVSRVLNPGGRNKNTNLPFQKNIELVSQFSPLHDALAIFKVLVTKRIDNIGIIQSLNISVLEELHLFHVRYYHLYVFFCSLQRMLLKHLNYSLVQNIKSIYKFDNLLSFLLPCLLKQN